MQNRYAHAKQYKRAAKQTRILKTYLGRVIRDIQRKSKTPSEQLQSLLSRAQAIHAQQRHDKNKIYSLHEPAVYCIAKGKSHKPYEFGNKVSIVTSSNSNWVLSAISLSNPFDGHTLKQAIKQVIKFTGITPEHSYCDLGYRGHKFNKTGLGVIHLVGKIPKTFTKTAKKWMKRRAAVEPVIGHLKSDNRMDRNYLKGETGNRVNAILAASAFNFRKLLKEFYCFLRNMQSKSDYQY